MITVKQIDYDGNGASRTFNRRPGRDLDATLARIASAYNFDGGRTRVALNGRDITDEVAARKP